MPEMIPNTDDATIDRRIIRVTIDQQLRVIFKNPYDVQCTIIIAPTGNPQIGLLHESADFDPSAFGVNDFNRLAPVAVNVVIPFTLLANEALFAAVASGKSHFTLFIPPPPSVR
jgi:hypothetical protein